MASKPTPESLISTATKAACDAGNASSKLKGHSIRYAKAVLTLCALPLLPEVLASHINTLVTEVEKIEGIGKGYASNAKRVAAAGRDAAEKAVAYFSDEGNGGWKALSTVFSSKTWSETFPPITASGRKGKTETDKAKAPADIRVDTRDGAILALQSMMAAKTKLGIQTGKPLDTLENALTEALSILRAAKPAETAK